jgi:Tol biopolymer transport system component
MTFSARRLTFSSLLLTASAIAQSGTPAPMTPLANPDPRLAAIHAKMGGTRAPGQVAISPDGTLIAWTTRSREGAQLHLTEFANPDISKDKIISPNSATNCSNGAPVWSPDSQTLAYTSSCTSKEEKPGQDQIFLYSRATAASRQLTHVAGIFQQAAFAPNGKSLAFLFVENATRSAGALAAMKPWAGVIGEDGVEIQRVASVPTTEGSLSFLTPANLHVYEFNWAPNSQEIAFVAAAPPGENNWWVAQLYTEHLTGQPKAIFDPNTTNSALHGLQIAVPRFSPDGKRIAFIGGLMSDQGSTGGDVWVVNAQGGEPTDITPDIDGTPCYEAWLNDNRIGFVEERRGHMLLPDYDVAKRSLIAGSAIDLGEVNVSGGPIKDAISFSNNGIFAFVKSGHDTPPELWAGPGDAMKQITHFNDGAKPPVHVESVEWTNDGFHVQGWLTYPVDYDAKK